MRLDKKIIEQISKINNEPEWLLNKRIEAFDKIPTSYEKSSRRFEYSKFNFQDYDLLDNGETNFHEKYIENKISSNIFIKTKKQALIQVGKKFFNNIKTDNFLFADIKTILKTNPVLFEKYFINSLETINNEKYELYNYALWNNGYFLYIPKNMEVQIPIHYIFLMHSQGKVILQNNFIILEEGSKATFIDSQLSNEFEVDSLVNNLLNVYIGDGAKLDYISIQEYNTKVNLVNRKCFNLKKNSVVNWHEIVFGGSTVRSNYKSQLMENGAEAYMNAIYFAKDNQQMEFNTAQIHNVGYTKSDLLFAGAVSDKAKTSYEGIIKVCKGAQKTDAYQKNKNLVLSKEAHADSEPLLEIEANDVRCTHGATVGPIDPDDLFYLMSRGIEKEIAKKLLIAGFFNDVLQKIPLDEIKEAIESYIENII